MHTILVNPTQKSNWVIDNILLCGAHPQTDTDVQNLLKCGITTFISLVPRYQVEQKDLYNYWDGLPHNVQFYNVPIPDQKTISDKNMYVLCHAIIDMLYRGEVVYVHCMHGHGRVGTLVGCLLQLVSEGTLEDIFEYIQTMHSSRAYGGCVQSPSTIKQIRQVSRFSFFDVNVMIINHHGVRGNEMIKTTLKHFEKCTIYTNSQTLAKHLPSANFTNNIQSILKRVDIALVVIFGNNEKTQSTIKLCEATNIYVRVIKPI